MRARGAAALTVAMLLLVGLVAPVAAQSPLAPDEQWPQEVFETAGDGIDDDSQNDRGVLTTTAQTQPARTVTAQYDYIRVRRLLGTPIAGGIGLAGIKGGVTDRLQLSAQTSQPFDSDASAVGIKYQLLRRDRIQLAVHGNYLYLYESDLLVVHGLAASRCLDQTCGALLTANVSHRFSRDSAGELVLESSLLLPLMPHLKLVAEAEIVNIELGERTTQEITRSARYGLRLHGWRASLTLAVVKPLKSLGISPDIVWLTGAFRY